MYYPILADRVRYYKEDEKGIGEMCKIIEDIVNEEKKEIAIKSLKLEISPEKVAEITGLSLDEVKKLKESLLVLV
jgi:predicted transposase YdaD